jgi:hypothetical protein
MVFSVNVFSTSKVLNVLVENIKEFVTKDHVLVVVLKQLRKSVEIE